MILAPIVRRKTEEEENFRMTRRVQFGVPSSVCFRYQPDRWQGTSQIGTVEGNPYDYSDRLRQFATAQGIPSNTRVKINARLVVHPMAVASSFFSRPIFRPKEFSTLAHELAHEILHRGERRATTTKK